MCPVDVNVAVHEMTEFDTGFRTVEVFPHLRYSTAHMDSVLPNISNKLPVCIIKHTRGEVSTTLLQNKKSGIWTEDITEKAILMITFP